MTLQSVDHALSVLEILRVHEEVGVSELAKMLEVSPSSAHRLLTTMVARGFVEQSTATHRYTAGAALRVPLHASEQARAGATHKLLERLAEATGETVHLAMLHGRFVRYIDSALPRRQRHAPSLLGTTVPAHASSSGKAMLARRSPAALSSILASEQLEIFGPHTIGTRSLLNRELMTVRLHGYAKDIGEWKAGTTAMSVSIVPEAGRTLALSIAACDDRLRLVREETRSPERELFKELCAASRALTSQLAG